MKEYFNKYFIDIIKNHCFDFKGKMDNRTFSFFFLNWFLVCFLVFLGSFTIFLLHININSTVLSVYMIIMSIIYTCLLVPCFFSCIRRQRDISEKYWFLFFLLILIPFIGNFIHLVVLCIMPSERKKQLK